MEKLAVIGLKSEKDKLLHELMDIGMVEITDQGSLLEDEKWSAIAERDGDEEKIAGLEASVGRVEQALELVQKYSSAKEPMIFTRKAMKKSDFSKVIKDPDEIEAKVNDLNALGEKVHSLNDKLNRNNSDIAALTPWKDYDLPLDLTGTDRVRFDLGMVPAASDVAKLKESCADGTDGAVTLIGSDKDLSYLTVMSLDEDHDQVMDKLKEFGFTPVQFTGRPGTPAENIEKLTKENAEAESEIAETEKLIAEYDKYRNELECYHDQLAMDAEREKIQTYMLKTGKAFDFEGWVPSKCKDKVNKLLEDNHCIYEYREVEDDEHPPVMLKDTAFATPFTAIVDLYSRPDYHGFDPTNILAVFYAMFFGIMMSDAGYGLVIALGCFIILKKYPVEGMMQRMLKTFFWSGVFTIFWGAMFGGWFGDLIPTLVKQFTGKTITIAPIWFNPLDDPTKLLIFALILGVIHLYIGMGIDIYMKFKRGQVMDAICDDVVWMIIVLGAVIWLAGGSYAPALVTPAKYITIAAAIFVLVTGGRDKKGIGKITGGIGAIYNGVTGNLSDILSYARLLALGLATGVIATVINLLAAMVGKGVVGVILMAVILVIGHVFNIAINALGAYVHSSRLQYIEFFGRFYEDGGEPFAPFDRNTKYVRLTDD